MPSRVQIDLVATDSASATLDKVRSQLELFPTFAGATSDLTTKTEGLTRATTAFHGSLTHSTRAVRELTGPLLSGLSPALGQTASEMALVVRGAAMLGSGFGVVGIAAVGLAGIVGGKLIAAFEDARKESELFNRALASGDIERTGLQIDALSKKIIGLSEGLREFRSRAAPEGGVGSGEEAGFGAFLTGMSQKKMDEAIEQARQLREAREKMRDVEVPGGTLANQNALEGANARATFETQQAQRGLLDFRLGSIDQTNRELLRKAADLEAAGQPEAAAKQRQAAEARRLFDQAGLLGGGATDVGQGFEQATAGAESTADKIARIGIEARQSKIAIDELRASLESEITGGQMETALVGPTLEDEARGRQLQVKELERQLEITQQLATLNAARTDLTLQQRETLALEAIEMERILKLQLAQNDQAKIFGAEIEAQLKRQQVLEATDATAGFKRGLTNVEVEFGSAGLRMQEAARTMGGDIARTLSDSMLGPLEERLKGLPPLFRGILLSMARAVTDDIGKAITAQMFGGLKSLLGGGGSAGLVPFGEGGGAGGGPLGVGGDTNITLNVAGRPLPQSELSAAYAAGGEAGVRALRAGEATVVGGQYIPQSYGITSPEATQSAYTLMRPTPSLFDRALPIAGNAAALGLSAFGATGARTGFDVGASGALGALTGAGFGQSIGNLFGGAGGSIGAGTGALLGAGINTTIALLAKQEADKQALKQRQAAEAAQAVGAGAALASSAGGGDRLADLQRRITAFGLPSTGGSAQPSVPVTVQTPQGLRLVGTDQGQDPVNSVLDLLRNPESLQASILAGVDPAIKGPQEAATSASLQATARDLAAQFREREQGVGVTETDRLGGGLTRRTTVPASRFGAPFSPVTGAGGDLSIDELALNALSDDDRAVLLLDVLSRVAGERDIQSTISDGATGQIVSITRIARSSVGLPAGPPVAVPINTGSPTTTAPSTTTGQLLTAGGALALGLAASLADPNSLINAILPTGYTGTDLGNLITSLFSTQPAAGTAITWANGSTSNISSDTLRSLQGGLEGSGQEAFTALNADPAGGAGLGLGSAVDALGGIAALYGLLQGAQAEDPLSIVQSVLGLYSAVAGLTNTVLGPTLPTITGLLGEAVGAIANAAAGGGIAGAEAALSATAYVADAVAAAAPYIAAVAPVLIWAIHYLTTPSQTQLKSLASIGQPATQLKEAAETGGQQANAIFAQLQAAGVTDPAVLEQALTFGANALLPFYQTVPGPAAPVSVADYFRLTGEDATAFKQTQQTLMDNIFRVTQQLRTAGVTTQQLGALPVNPEWNTGMFFGLETYTYPEYTANPQLYDLHSFPAAFAQVTGGPFMSMLAYLNPALYSLIGGNFTLNSQGPYDAVGEALAGIQQAADMAEAERQQAFTSGGM